MVAELNEKTEERVREAMEASGFDVTIESSHIRFSTPKRYISAYQFGIMQMAGQVEYIDFPTNTIYLKRFEKSINQSNLSKSDNKAQEIFPYLPVKFNRLSFEFRCLQCKGALIHKIVEPNEGSLCSNCMQVFKHISDQYESAPTRVSFDPEEVKEYENGGRPKAEDKGVSTLFGPSS